MEKVVIASLKYSIGLFKEMVVHETCATNHNFKVRKVLSEEYQAIDDTGTSQYYGKSKGLSQLVKSFFGCIVFRKKRRALFSLFEGADYIVFYNSHPLNLIIARRFKNKVKKIVQVMHEPYMPDKDKYGFFISLRISVLEWIQKQVLNQVNHIVVPSVIAKEMFEYKYPKYPNPVDVSPLFIEEVEFEKTERRFFTIIGRDHPAKNFNVFFELIRKSNAEGRNHQFCIISISNLESYLSQLNSEERATLTVINKPHITDAEIDEVLSKSLGVFKLDKPLLKVV